MKQHRKHHTAEEKVAILRRHFLEKVPVSNLGEETGIQPTVFYRWQKEFLENGAAAFESKTRAYHGAERERIESLEKKIQAQDQVLAELMAEHVARKKSLGELGPGSGCRTTHRTRSWIPSGAGRRRPRAAPGVSSGGWE